MSTTQQTTGRRGKTQTAAAVVPGTTASVHDVVAVAPTNVVTNVVEVAVAPAAAPKPRGKRSQVEVAVAPVQTEQLVAVQSPAVACEGLECDASITKSFEDLMKEIAELDKKIAELQRNRQTLTKESAKLHSQQSRQLKKNKKDTSKSSKRAMSGFNKPKLVPAAFRVYLGLEANAELPRTEVTKQLYAKIKASNLLDEADKRKIVADPTLRTLFRMQPNEQIEFNTFQGFVSRVYENDPETQAFKAAEAQAQALAHAQVAQTHVATA